MLSLAERAAAIAGDRQRGASALAAELMLVLDAAVHTGLEATREVARVVCHGQPAMASLWNLCAAAVVEFDEPGRYLRRRQEIERAPRALARLSAAWLHDALGDDTSTFDDRTSSFDTIVTERSARNPAGPDRTTQLLTVSFSGSVARTLVALAQYRSLHVVCAGSLPGGEGAELVKELTRAGVAARVVLDATLTSHLPGASAVLLGADAVSSRDWTNKVGTLGIAAAAGVFQTPVYVLTTRDKAASDALDQRLSASALFERTPASLATGFLTDAGVIRPDDLAAFTSRYATDIARLLEHLT